MKRDDPARLYDRLTPDERFRLRIRAMARGDTADVDRLDRTCPRKSYTALDGAYTDRLDASDALTLCVLAELLPRLAKLTMVAACRELVGYLAGRAGDAAADAFLDGHRAGWRAAGKRGEPPQVADDDLTAATGRAQEIGTWFGRVLDDVAAALAADARTSREALANFCRDELGLSVEELLGAWAQPTLAVLATHQDALDAAEPDPTGVEMFGRALGIAWRRRGLNDPTAEVDEETRAAIEGARVQRDERADV